jgi:3-deoxy-D-manno-octulosonic-acid transferase
MVRCAVPFACALILWRSMSDRRYREGLAQRLGFGPRVSAPSIWVHAVSLGEMSAAAPLLRALRSRYPAIPLVITTATPAGRSRAQALLGPGADVRYLAYDTPGSVRRFLARVQPRVALIMETELWPNLLRECRRRAVPVLLASARLSEKSVSRYRRFGSLFRSVFNENLLIAAQTEADAGRFRAIGAADEQVRVIGNAKFDVELDPGLVQAGRNLRAAYGSHRPVWIAGSTHAGEEEQLLDAHARLLRWRPDALLLLVPRHQARFEAVAELLEHRGVAFARRSQMTGGAAGTPQAVMLADTIGELPALYASADVAFVGGSLVAVGGHNLLEPVALGLPVLTGPSYFNSKEIARLLLERGAALQVKDAQELAQTLQLWLEDAAERDRVGSIGEEIIAANRGSVARLLLLIEPWLRVNHPGAPVPACP